MSNAGRGWLFLLLLDSSGCLPWDELENKIVDKQGEREGEGEGEGEGEPPGGEGEGEGEGGSSLVYARLQPGPRLALRMDAEPGGVNSVVSLDLESGEASLPAMIRPPVVGPDGQLWVTGRAGLVARFSLDEPRAAIVVGAPRDPAVERFVVGGTDVRPVLWALTDEGVLFWSTTSIRAGGAPDARIAVPTDRFSVGGVALPELSADRSSLLLRTASQTLARVTIDEVTGEAAVDVITNNGDPVSADGRGNLGLFTLLSRIVWETGVTESDPLEVRFGRTELSADGRTGAQTETVVTLPGPFCSGADCVLAIDVDPGGSRAVLLTRGADPAANDVVFHHCPLGLQENISCASSSATTLTTRPLQARLSLAGGRAVATMLDHVLELEVNDLDGSLNVVDKSLQLRADGSGHSLLVNGCLITTTGGSFPQIHFAAATNPTTNLSSTSVPGGIRDIVAVPGGPIVVGGGFDGNDAPTAAQLLWMPAPTQTNCATDVGGISRLLNRLGPERPGTDVVGVVFANDQLWVGDVAGNLWRVAMDAVAEQTDWGADRLFDAALSGISQRRVGDDPEDTIFAIVGNDVLSSSPATPGFSRLTTCPDLIPRGSVDVEPDTRRLVVGGYLGVGVVDVDFGECAVLPFGPSDPDEDGLAVAAWLAPGFVVAADDKRVVVVDVDADEDGEIVETTILRDGTVTGPRSLVRADARLLLLLGVDDGYALDVDVEGSRPTLTVTPLSGDNALLTPVALRP